METIHRELRMLHGDCPPMVSRAHLVMYTPSLPWCTALHQQGTVCRPVPVRPRTGFAEWYPGRQGPAHAVLSKLCRSAMCLHRNHQTPKWKFSSTQKWIIYTILIKIVLMYNILIKHKSALIGLTRIKRMYCSLF